MDATTTFVNALRNLVPGSSSPVEFTIGLVVAMAILRMEVARRLDNMPQQSVGQSSAGYAAYCKKLLGYAPETMGLLFCLGLAGALRMQGSSDFVFVSDSTTAHDKAAHIAAMAEVARQWPILLTADTLLSLQAMLRVCVLASSVLRRGAGPSLLTQEAVAVSCGAALGRVVLVAHSNVYMLDGPLGGNLPVACELFSLAFLLVLCRGVHFSTMTASTLTLAAAACIASRNRLNLAGDPFTDGLFTFANIAELLAAFAYLSRAVFSDIETDGTSADSVALRFAHTIMPAQACLAAYYFVQAFEVTPQLIGAGHPFELLQWGCVAQVGAYAGASLLHWAESVEESQGSAGNIPQHIAIQAAL